MLMTLLFHPWMSVFVRFHPAVIETSSTCPPAQREFSGERAVLFKHRLNRTLQRPISWCGPFDVRC